MKIFERQAERERMVAEQIAGREIKDERVLSALQSVPRHRFVLDSDLDLAYDDHPLSIGHGQTISQPYIVGFMTQALNLQPQDKVLEIGTGSGYQTAVLAELVNQVYTVEIVDALAKRAASILTDLGYTHVKFRSNDGYHGWPEEAPFQAIIVTAAAEETPQPLLNQLSLGGRMIIPVGKFLQELVLIHRSKNGFQLTKLLPVAFVPLIAGTNKEN